MAMHQGLIARNFSATPTGYQVMIDSAFPANTVTLHGATITLAYIGGDTVHVWTGTEIKDAAARTPLIWPCWVRSNPSQVSASADANACVSTLKALGVPKGVSCILDLETAVATGYVNTFNAILTAAGYTTTKYGSQGSIWNNPKTSGGTFIAAPGIAFPITMGDAVATQFDFAGSFDLSWVKDGVPLWEAGDMAITDADAAKIAAAVGAQVVDSSTNATINGVLRRADRNIPTLAAETDLQAVARNVATIMTAVSHQVDPAAVATAVVSQLAASGETADTIAQHVLAGLPPTLAADVVAAMGAKLSA